MTDIINYKFELFEGPLELLMSLVAKNKLKIEDIPIDLLCEQYMEYISEAATRNIELACEFLYMASELMLIKSRMLLPRDPEKDEDPRQPLIDAMLEYQKTKLAASELSELYSEFGSRMIKEQDDISKDKTYVCDHSVDLLREALIHVLSETKINSKEAKKQFDKIVHTSPIPVETIMTSLLKKLKDAPVYLDSYFRESVSRSEMIAKFISILELLKMHSVALEKYEPSETGVMNMGSHVKLIIKQEQLDNRNSLEIDAYM